MPNQYKLQNFTYTRVDMETFGNTETMKEAFKIHKRNLKTQPPRLLTDEEVRMYEGYGIYGPKEKNDIRQAAINRNNGDYAAFESVTPAANAYECTRLFYELRDKFGDDGISMANPLFSEYAMDNRMNPFFRLALEMAYNTPDLEPAELKTRCREIAIALNEKIMLDTLNVPTNDQREKLYSEMPKKDADEMIEANQITQSTMAKMMFMAHLGKIHTVDDDGKNEEYTGSMTEVLAHGGRMLFNFAKEEPGQNTLENMVFYNHDGKTAVSGRFAATHTVKAVDSEGAGAYEEKSSKGSLVENYAMNPAVGGIGNEFCGKTILNDGEDGHCYIKMGEGSAKQSGYMMWGIESAASGSTGKSGRTHGTGGSGLASAFMAGKSAPGAKMGGRVADLSCWNKQTLNAILKTFDKHYAALQQLASADEQGREHFNEVNRCLAGKTMQSPEALLEFMTEKMGIENIQIGDKQVDVQELVDHRTREGNKSFEELNKKRDLERRYNDPQKGELAVSEAFENFSNLLDKTKKTIMGISAGDSDLMKDVKRSLEDVQLILNDRDRDEAALHTQMKNLRDFAKKYLDNRSANNERRKLVQGIFELSDKQLPANERINVKAEPTAALK